MEWRRKLYFYPIYVWPKKIFQILDNGQLLIKELFQIQIKSSWHCFSEFSLSREIQRWHERHGEIVFFRWRAGNMIYSWIIAEQVTTTNKRRKKENFKLFVHKPNPKKLRNKNGKIKCKMRISSGWNAKVSQVCFSFVTYVVTYDFLS